LIASGRKIYPIGDSLLVIGDTMDSTFIPVSDISIDTIYHNDRTAMEAAELTAFLTGRGVDTTQFTISTVLQPVKSQKSPRFSKEEIPLKNDNEVPLNDRLIAIVKE
jgi:hypothetical protein